MAQNKVHDIVERLKNISGNYIMDLPLNDRLYLKLLLRDLSNEQIADICSNFPGNNDKKFFVNQSHNNYREWLQYIDNKYNECFIKNENVEELLHLYTNKKSKKVQEARKKLQTRYLYLSYGEQVAIMKEFLHSCKTDRQWCYYILHKKWAEDVADDVLKIWEKYKEERCGWVITKYYPEEVLLQYIDLLSTDSNYYNLCKRLVKNKFFKVDKERLRTLCNDTQYLWIMSQTQNGILEQEAMEIVYKKIAVAIHYLDKEDDPNDKNFSDGRNISSIIGWNIKFDNDEALHMSQLKNMDKILTSILRMGFTIPVENFMKLDEKIRKEFINSSIFLDLKKQHSDKEYETVLYTKFAIFWKKNFPAEYQRLLDYWKGMDGKYTECQGVLTPIKYYRIYQEPFIDNAPGLYDDTDGPF